MTLDQFLEQLKEVESNVVITPLADEDVTYIESALGRTLPSYYKEFLFHVGVKQDAIWGLHSRITDFNSLQDFLPEQYASNFFQFRDNGGEDYWLLRNDDPEDRTIYEYEYYGDGQIKSLGKTFDDLLDESIRQLLKNRKILIPNAQKVWSVQFSINANTTNAIVASLQKEFECRLIEEPTNTRISSTGVISSEGRMKLQGIETSIRKQEYRDWKTASYSFNWYESVSEMKANSLIKRIEKRLKHDGFNVMLIDYGILPNNTQSHNPTHD